VCDGGAYLVGLSTPVWTTALFKEHGSANVAIYFMSQRSTVNTLFHVRCTQINLFYPSSPQRHVGNPFFGGTTCQPRNTKYYVEGGPSTHPPPPPPLPHEVIQEVKRLYVTHAHRQTLNLYYRTQTRVLPTPVCFV